MLKKHKVLSQNTYNVYIFYNNCTNKIYRLLGREPALYQTSENLESTLSSLGAEITARSLINIEGIVV